METYRYRSVDWAPGSHLSKPLKEVKIALISSAGLHLPGQPPFDKKIRGGDFSFREIPAEVDVSHLEISHRSTAWSRAGARADGNLVFPLDRLREFVQRGELGALSQRHFSFMGSITAPARLIKQSAPAVAQKLAEDGVDAVLLVPA
jgi:D-proline reductase (dithiol) PrdB